MRLCDFRDEQRATHLSLSIHSRHQMIGFLIHAINTFNIYLDFINQCFIEDMCISRTWNGKIMLGQAGTMQRNMKVDRNKQSSLGKRAEYGSVIFFCSNFSGWVDRITFNKSFLESFMLFQRSIPTMQPRAIPTDIHWWWEGNGRALIRQPGMKQGSACTWTASRIL